MVGSVMTPSIPIISYYYYCHGRGGPGRCRLIQLPPFYYMNFAAQVPTSTNQIGSDVEWDVCADSDNRYSVDALYQLRLTGGSYCFVSPWLIYVWNPVGGGNR